MESVKRRVIAFWLTHTYLRRIAKRYPEYFEKRINDLTDNRTERKIFKLRYMGDYPLKFEAIACELNIDLRRVFSYHKDVIDTIIYGQKES